MQLHPEETAKVGGDVNFPLNCVQAKQPVCRVSASVQGQERLSHIGAMHSQFTLLFHLRG